MASIMGSKGFRAAGILGILGLFAAGLVASPVGAALNQQKVKRIVGKLTYTESESDSRFVNVGEIASDAQTLDSIDSTAFVKNADSYTRHWTCPGLGFVPDDSSAAWNIGGNFEIQGTAGVRFQCPVDLPEGAVVTAVEWRIRDTDATPNADAGELQMFRGSLAAPFGAVTEMADAGETSGAPGDVVLSDTTIEAATIDNDSFAYFVRTFLNGPPSLWGATITYTVTAAQGGG